MINKLKYLVVVVIGFIPLCHSKVNLYVRVYNYQNGDDIKFDGNKCDSFHWLNNYCDPVFHICITSHLRCDILNHSIDHWKNKKILNSVFSRIIVIEKIEKSFIFDVRVDDHDKLDGNDHIARFTSQYQITQLDKEYGGRMTVTPSDLNVHLYSSIKIQCYRNYYGPNCDLYCKPKQFVYDCNIKSGEKICVIDCGLYGSCFWINESDEFVCKCTIGWTGENCQFSDFGSCSTLDCNQTCTYTKTVKYCNCMLNGYIRLCQDPLISTSANIKQTTTNIRYKQMNLTTNLWNYNKKSTSVVDTKSNHETEISFVPNKDHSEQQSSVIKSSEVSPMIIVIICLLILLCICIVLLSISIRNWKNKEKTKNNGYLPTFLSQRPLPRVIYRPKYFSENVSPSISIIQNRIDDTQTEYDLCTVQSECTYEAPLIKFDHDSTIYEDPIIGNTEDNTCVSDLLNDEDNDSVQYLEPRNML